MTTFNVLASTAYRLSITEPTVAGNPAPTISYAWSYNGTPIGDNNRIVNAYTFPSLPGTLSCTVTATNWGGSVSETVTATIAEQLPVPILNAVSIRVASAPTAIVTELPSAAAGVVLTVGGPVPAATAPTGLNIGSLAYQWRRNGNAISGATAQTYTLVASDIDTTISVEVTATNAGQSDTDYAVVRVGNAAANAGSRIGGHGPDVNYYTASVGFANLTHAMAPMADRDGIRGSLHPNRTEDGWPIFTVTTWDTVQNYIFGLSPWNRLSMLGITGEWDATTPASNNPTRYGITDSYRIRYKITVYWEGSDGRAQIVNRGRSGSNAAITNFSYPPQTSAAFSSSTVQFANGDPFGEGVERNFFKRTTEFGPVSVRSNHEHNLSVYENDTASPFKNAIVLVHDVEREVGGVDSGVWETVYAGLTHHNYTPFAMYPAYVGAMQHFKTLRFLSFGWAHNADQNISQATGTSIEGLNYPYNALHDQYRDLPATFGVAEGFGALNRPTHVAFGRSLRAACEICSAIGCDLWWNHPFHSTYVGNTPGEVKVREAYLQMFAETVNQHLAPGLKVYSEWGNETWNTQQPYFHGHRYAQNQGLRLANASGQLVLRDYRGQVTTQPDFWGNTAGNPNIAMFAYNAAASAAISAYLRPLMPGRELVAVWAAQDSVGELRYDIRQAAMALWETIPWVFDELNAYAVAPYRTPPVANATVEAGTLTTAAAFDAIESAGWLLPASDPASQWASGRAGKPGMLQQKQFALDLDAPYADPAVTNYSFKLAGDEGKRRWNLRLIAYECGQHAVPATNATKEFQRLLQYEPRYFDYYYRHYETLLSSGPAPMVTTRQADGYFGSTSQVIANGEPLYDMVCDLEPIGRHVDAWYWATQQFNGEIGAPRATALRQIVLDQPWSSP